MPSFSPLRRALLASAALAVIAPRQAFALSVMDPFNLPTSMDAGGTRVADGLVYGDKPRHKLDVYAPTQMTAAAPVVFFIYGGGWSRGERSEYQFVGQALASRGFVVVIADYRLYPDVVYPDFLYDCAAALGWVEDNIGQYGGDANRLFLAGHSAGAYNAVMLGLDPSFLREFGVSLTVRGVAALSGPYDFYPFEYNEVREVFGKAPNPQGTQPISLVTNQAPPMYLASGTSDPIVRVQNTEHFAQTLKDAGVWVTTKYYDGFGHMEPVLALGAMWRWRMPAVLDDMVGFFQMFGAFPNGTTYVAVAPEAPEQLPDSIAPMDQIVQQMNAMFQPIEN